MSEKLSTDIWNNNKPTLNCFHLLNTIQEANEDWVFSKEEINSILDEYNKKKNEIIHATKEELQKLDNFFKITTLYRSANNWNDKNSEFINNQELSFDKLIEIFSKQFSDYESINLNFYSQGYIYLDKNWKKFIYNINSNEMQEVKVEYKSAEFNDYNSIKNEYIKIIDNINDPNIDKNKLKEFIDYSISLINSKKLFINNQNLIIVLNNRISDIKNNPSLWINLLINQIVWVFNNNPYDKDKITWIYKTYNFDENKLKENILNIETKDWWKSFSNVDWKIKDLSMVIENNDASHILPTIEALLKHNINDNNFKLNLLYTDERVKLTYEKIFKDQLEKINFIHAIDSVWIKWKTWIWSRDWAVIWPNWQIIESITNYNYKQWDASSYDSLALSDWNDIKQSKFFFQWWNIRQTENKLFIWKNDIIWNIKKNRKWILNSHDINPDKPINKSEVAEIIDWLKKEFWKNEIIIMWWDIDENNDYIIDSNLQWDLYHIDLYLTPISNNEVILWRLENWNINNEYLEMEAKKLESKWIKVNRINNYSWNIDWNWAITYNNRLIEKYLDKDWVEHKKVYLPSYDLESLNKNNSKNNIWIDENTVNKYNNDAIEQYKKLWFEVISIPISWFFVNNWWALNCLTFERRKKEEN